MTTFKKFLDSNGIKETQLVVASDKKLAASNESRQLLVKRSQKRRTAADKTYAELNIAKPVAGRGVSLKQVAAAVEGKPLPRKVRSKMLLAVNSLLERKKKAAVEMKALFEGAEIKKGKAKEEKKADGKK